VGGGGGLGESKTLTELVDDELKQAKPAFTSRRVEPTGSQVLGKHRHRCTPELVEVARLRRQHINTHAYRVAQLK